MRRRDFLLALPPLAALGIAIPGRSVRRVPPRRLRILVLGGTNYVGPHLVEAARERGHQVTLFNRGRTNPHLFPELERLRGNRYPDRGDGLAALESDRTWDTVLDTWQGPPGCVDLTARLLGGRVGRYVYISSIAAYRHFRDPGIAEDGPLREASERMGSLDPELPYPMRKRAAEQAVERRFGDRGVLLRCGSIQGYLAGADPDHLGYWGWRFVHGRELLLPDDPGAVVQYIDVEDVARFAVGAVERGVGGAFNLVGPEEPLPLLEYLDAWHEVTGRRATVVPVDPAFLLERGVRPFEDLPLWIPPDDPEPGFFRVDNTRGRRHGLTFRPLAETLRDIVESVAGEAGTVPGTTPAAPGGRGLSPARERELLEAWRARADARGPRSGQRPSSARARIT